MRILLLCAWLMAPAFAGEAPFYTQELKKEQDTGAVNQNFRELSNSVDQLNDSTVPPEHEQCIFNPMFCVSKYNNLITQSSTSFTGASVFSRSLTASSFTATGEASFTLATSTVSFSGWVDIGWEKGSAIQCAADTTCSASCPSGKRAISCYCSSALGNMTDCQTTAFGTCTVTATGANVTVGAYCARVK